MDKGHTVPKWALIVWPKIPQMPQNLSAQAQKFWISIFNEKRLHWVSVVRDSRYHHAQLTTLTTFLTVVQLGKTTLKAISNFMNHKKNNTQFINNFVIIWDQGT